VLNLSFTGVSCLAVATNKSISDLLVGTLRQIGMSDVTKAGDIQQAVHLVSANPFDIVICVALEGNTYMDVLLAVRNHRDPAVCRVPVLCISESWEADQITALRDAGVTIMGMFPVNMRSVLKHVTRALSDKREFINTPTYKGIDRRKETPSNYSGPLRRASDAQPRKASHHEPQDEPPGQGAPAPFPPTAPAFVPPPSPTFSSITGNDPVRRQTNVVVHDAEVTAHHILSLFDKLKTTPEGRGKADLTQYISESLDRWVNLMVVVGSRIEAYGCTPDQLDAIRNIRHSFREHVFSLADILVNKLIGDAERLTSGIDPIPIGSGVVMAHRLSVVDSMVQSLEGVEPLNDTMTATLAKAAQIVTAVIDLESRSIVLPDFSHKRERP